MKFSIRIKLDSIIYLYIFLSAVLLLIPAFINFDAHHDGLILTTTLELRRAIETGGDWPFNQYGQLWAFPFVLTSFLVNDQYLLITIRILTFAYYLASSLLIHKVSSRYLSTSLSKIPSFIFLLAQPFALGLNSTFLPWPSALCSLLIIITLERLTSEFQTQRKSDYAHVTAGFLVFGVLGTRLQVGLLLLIMVPLLLFAHRKVREACAFLVGFLSALVLVESLMHSQGWLVDSLFDSVIFSLQYVSGDTSTYPLPKVTFLLSTFILIVIFVIVNLSKKDHFSFQLTLRSVVLIALVLFIALLVAASLSDLRFTNWLTLFIRRMWISFSIALLIYSFFLLLSPLLKRRDLFGEVSYSLNMLLLFSLCSFTQIAPLFDQMHFWWGFSPFVILATVIVKEKFLEIFSFREVAKPIFVIVGTVLLFMNILGVVKQITSSKNSIGSSIAVGVLAADPTDDEISDFLNSSINQGSSVLNLCPNSNVFFSVKSSYSSIREFVLWSPTFDFTKYKKSFMNAEYDYIVACPMQNAEDVGQMKVNSSIEEIVRKAQLPLIRTFADSHGRLWAIYKENE